MRREELTIELLELAQQHGIDLDSLSTELSASDLEVIVGGKQRLANRMADVWLSAAGRLIGSR